MNSTEYDKEGSKIYNEKCEECLYVRVQENSIRQQIEKIKLAPGF